MIPEPPAGFRLLTVGERVQVGDLFYAHGSFKGWLNASASVGDTVEHYHSESLVWATRRPPVAVRKQVDHSLSDVALIALVAIVLLAFSGGLIFLAVKLATHHP